jgi:hypothetical protein
MSISTADMKRVGTLKLVIIEHRTLQSRSKNQDNKYAEKSKRGLESKSR